MHTRILSVFFLALIVACGGGGSSSPAPIKEPTSEPPPPDPEPTVKLVPGGSAEQFAAFLKEGLAQWSGVGSESQSEAIQVMTQAMSNSDDADLIAEFNSANAPQPSPSVAADAAPDINVQVSGVDEADRARFTGQTLYVAERLEIRVLPTSDDGSSTRLADTLRLDYPNGEIQGLYLHMGGQSADQLVSITSEYPRYWGHAYGEPWQWRGGVTHLDLFNIDDQEQPVKREQITLEGYLMTTRRIDNMLYLVTRFTPELKGLVTPAVTDEEKETNTGLIEAVSVEDLLPMLSGKNAAGMDLTPVHLVNADACFVPELNNQNVWHPSIVTVTAINLEDTTEFQSVCMADEVSGYYVSPEALYLTSGRYGDVIALAEPVPADPAFAPEPPQDSTVIHKFNLTNQGPAYAGSGDVTGTFSGGDPAYRMGEHQGFLTIVTSESWGQNHRLTVLGESTSEDYLLEEMGHIPNDTAPATIGKPGEQIYSSRIIGDRAYIVTYQTIDPVYVIDLSTPGSPTIL
jgi:uncharacterized secreted protein with C-terminal beta-propeller domain